MSSPDDKCPTIEQIERAFTERETDDMAAHFDQCASCAQVYARLERTASAARSLPIPPMGEERRRDLKQAIVARAQSQPQNESAGSTAAPKGRRVRFALAGAAVVLLAVALGLWSLQPERPQSLQEHNGLTPPEHAVKQRANEDAGHDDRPPQEASPVEDAPIQRATVHARDGANFARLSAQPDEIIRLYEGTITVQVDPLRDGERFRVITGDAEVEVHGTVFDVSSAEDRLSGVRVVRGVVEVRPSQAPTRTLHEGQAWNAPRTRRERPTAPAQRVPSASSDTRSGQRPNSSNDGAEDAFERGWRALQRGEPADAARLLGSVPQGAALGEDAAYWRAIALYRSEQQASAVRTFEEFLDAFPDSERAGRAQVNLGWMLIQMHRPTAARRWFDAAADDADATVRSSARRGLERVESALEPPVAPDR
jgi:redox-sensitive bicupin YhaK (pirin superfamily)